jgi:hypothetical protein
MMIAEFGLVVIKHLMKHKPTNKLSAHGHHLPKNAYPSTRASQSRTPAAHRQPSKGIQHRTTITFPRELNAAIENWRMLQLGQSSQPRSWS